MMGCILGGLRVLVKGILYFFLYTLPLWFCVAGFFGGAAAGTAATGEKYEKWEAQQIVEHTHEVTVHWDESNIRISVLQVRDDMNWSIHGSDTSGLYYTHRNGKVLDDYSAEFYSPDVALHPDMQRAGYKFLGLYTSPLGGTQFVNAQGYSVRTVTMDLDLYAVWEKE